MHANPMTSRAATPDGSADHIIRIPGPAGHTLCLDRFAQKLWPVPEGQEPRGLAALLDQVEAKAEGTDLEIDVLCGRPRREEITLGIGALLEALRPERLTLRLHVAPGSEWWRWALGIFGTLESGAVPDIPSDRRFFVYGTFTPPPEDAAEALVNLGAQARYTWIDGGAGVDRTREEHGEAITDLAMLGLRVPVQFYLRPGASELPRELTEAVLEWNLQSGISLAAIQEHPGYGTLVHGDALPLDEFVRVSTEIYHRHPHFDDVMDPPARMIDRMGRAPRVGNPVRVLFDESGRVRRYLKLPCQGLPLPSLHDLPEEVIFLRSALALPERGLPSSSATRCSPCQWRHVCRGTDAGNDATGGIDLTDWSCGVWMFWAAALLWERHLVHNHRAGAPAPGDEE